MTRVSPGSGELVLQGSQITVYVSTGKPQVSVPNLLGNTIAKAKATLGSDFTLKVTGDATDDAVIETQDPAAGTQVDKGSTISVTAKKPPPRIPTTTATAARRQVGTEPPGMAVVAIAV